MDKKQKEEPHVWLTEERKRNIHEQAEKRWAAKAKKEGWQYKPKPYVSEAERQAAARRQRIEDLKQELKQLMSEEEKEQLFESIKAENLD